MSRKWQVASGKWQVASEQVASGRVSTARRELARREAGRRWVVEFAGYVDPKQKELYQAEHLQLIGRYLEEAESGELWKDVPGEGVKILVIEAPPRHWKSSIVNKFGAWFIGKRVNAGRPHQVIMTSYGADLAETNSRTVLETVLHPRFKNIFPGLNISQTKRSAQKWALAGETHETCVAAGVGGALTGHGADCAIVDDPIKGPEEAYSEARREALWQWWTAVLRTRLNPGGFVLFLLTRWHEDDVVGRILKAAMGQPDGDRIRVLRLPALAETDEERGEVLELGLPVDEEDPLGRAPGEALWPERYSAEQLAATRDMDEIAFEAMYQGRPGKRGGYLLGRGDFRMLEVPPEKGQIRWVISTDWAMTEKETAPKKSTEPDWSVASLMGLWFPEEMNRREAYFVLAGIGRTQERGPEALRMVQDFALAVEEKIGQRPPIVGAQDNVDKLILDFMRVNPALMNWPIVDISRRMLKGDKVVKSHPWRSRAQNGRFYVVDDGWWGKPWNRNFFLEVEGFPRAAKDDQIDAVSVGAHYLAYGFSTKKAKSYQGGHG